MRLLIILASLAFNTGGGSAFIPRGVFQLSQRQITQQRLALQLNLAETAVVAGGIVGALLWFQGADGRAKRENWRVYEEKEEEEREKRRLRAYIKPKPLWTETELREYDGVKDMRGPLLVAADSLVFNAYKGRHFYGPGCEYHIFAGRDATRLLAKGLLLEESPESSEQPLNLAERAALAAWVMTLKSKYEVVGRLDGAGPSLSESVEAAIPNFMR
mmetsp:Transcript_38239/g.77204  ORF Transcript_38239/g.77204 Transcript_38239/m.77204 type:complete len:216 (+) Transcript_38239:169-816(+)